MRPSVVATTWPGRSVRLDTRAVMVTTAMTIGGLDVVDVCC